MEEAWQSVPKKSLANKLQLRKHLHTLRLQEGDSVQTHIKEIAEIFNKLSIIGDAISKEDCVVCLLASLPDSFNTLVIALEANTEVPTMEVVIERLLYEERKRTERDTTSGKIEGAMTVKQKRRGPRCYNCQNYGHNQRNCPQVLKTNARDERNPRNKSWRKETKQKVNKMDVTTNDSDGDVGLTVTHHKLNSVGVTETGCSDCWIIATCHICHERELFTCLKTLKAKQEVTLGDGRSLQATGSGTVELELVLPNGEPKKTTLHDVLSGLSYNLLSVVKMTDRGRKVSFCESWCQVVDNRKRVVACTKKKGGLYHLIFTHSTHHVVNMVESKETLWHRRLGHLGENNLKQMACEDLVLGFNYDIKICWIL